MKTITPDHGAPGQTLHILIQGLRTDLGPTPAISFFSALHIQDVMVIPGSVRQVQPGSYEFDITTSTISRTRQYQVVIGDRPNFDIVRFFTVGSQPANLASSASSQTSAIGGVAAIQPSQNSSDNLSKIFNSEARIFEAEAKIIEELAKASPQKICDPEWLKAAAEKECCSAKLIKALGDKEKDCSGASQTPSPPATQPASPGGGVPRVPFIPAPIEGEEELPSTVTQEIPEYYAIQEPSKDDCDADGVCKYGCTVLLHSGEERFDRVDLSIPGRGDIHFTMTRRYRSRLNYNGPLGFGWDFSFNEALFPNANGDILRSNGKSHLDTWVKNSDGSFTAPRGHFRTLIKESNGQYILRSPNGFKRYYRSDGRLEKYEDRFGNVMLFEYDLRGNLNLVIDPYGRGIEFIFGQFPDGQGGYRDRLSKVRDFLGREVHYHYDVHGDLIAVRSPVVTGTSTGNDFPNGRTEEYAYSSGFSDLESNHKILSITSPEEVAQGGEATITWTYGTDPDDVLTYGKVLTEAIGGINASGIKAGGTSSFVYESLNETVPFGDPNVQRGKVTITEPNGNQRVYFGNENNEHILTLQINRGIRPGEPPFYATRYFYNNDGLKVRMVLPEGNELRWKYDTMGKRGSQRNLIETRRIADSRSGGAEDIITKMTYEPLFNQVATITESRGNSGGFTPPLGAASADRYTTKFFYDYQEGDDPIDDVTRFNLDISNAIRGLGDLNDDGRINQVNGNLVRVEAPSVELLPNSNEANRLGSTVQHHITQNQWNDRGQIISSIDQEGNVTEYAYYPEDNPTGDGNATNTGYLPLSQNPLGYLKSITSDSKISPRRSSTETPAALKNSFSYDAVGNVISTTDARGVTNWIEVNQLNEPVKITLGANIDEAVHTDQLITGEDAFKYLTNIYYDHNGREVSVQLENRNLTVERVGAFARHQTIYDILGNTLETILEVDTNNDLHTKYRYDENNILIAVVRPEGDETRILVDDRNLTYQITQGYGTGHESTRQLDYDLNGNVIKEIDAEDKDGDGKKEETTFTYDGFDRLIQSQDALGNKSINYYDIASNVIRTEVHGHPAGSPVGAQHVLLSETLYDQDEHNRTFQIHEKLFLSDGFVSKRPIDLKDKNNDGLVTNQIEYDALSRITHTIEDDGEVFKNVYDGANRIIETIDALGNKEQFLYDRNSNPVKVSSIEVSPEGIVADETFLTQYVYDQLNRLVRATDNAGQTTRFTYDSFNNLILRSDAQGKETVDPLGLFPNTGQTGKINKPGNTKRFYYDGVGRLKREVSDLRQNGEGGGMLDMSNIFNPSGQIALGYEYDKNSRLTGVIDNNGNRTHFEYDALDRKTRHVYADGKEYTYRYDRDSNLISASDPNGTIIYKSYDALSRLIRCSVNRAAKVIGTSSEIYEYDGLSRVTKSVDDNGDYSQSQTCEYIYDSMSRVLEEHQNGEVISNVYHGDGTRLSCTYPGKRKIINKHDGVNRIKAIQDKDGLISEAFYIGPSMRELKRINKNGTSLSFMNDTGNMADGYDPVKRIIGLRTFLPDAITTFLDREYGYNRADQRTFEKRHEDFDLTDKYTYDSVYRLMNTQLDQNGGAGAIKRELKKVDYVLDGVGNRRVVNLAAGSAKKIHYDTNEVNQYTSIDGASQKYDHNGNLVAQEDRTLVYDYKNRLASVYLNESLLASYSYDTMNRRRKKVVYKTNKPGQVDYETHFYYDGWNVCEERNGSSKTEITMVYSPVYIDEPVQLTRTKDHKLGKGVLYTHQDAIANIVAISDENGDVIEKRFYDDYGQAYDENKLYVVGSSLGNPYGFQGRRMDSETGFYYFRNRYYDPEQGRFLQRDPVWDVGNVGNEYTFAGNGPSSRLDPHGTDWKDWFGVGERDSTIAAAIGGFFEGAGDGATVVANDLTMGMITPLDEKSECIKESYGEVGEVMNFTSKGSAFLLYTAAGGWVGGLRAGAAAKGWGAFNQFIVKSGLYGTGMAGGISFYVGGSSLADYKPRKSSGPSFQRPPTTYRISPERSLELLQNSVFLLGAGGQSTIRPSHAPSANSSIRMNYLLDPQVRVSPGNPNYSRVFFRSGGFRPRGYHIDHVPARAVAHEMGIECSLIAIPGARNTGYSQFDRHHGNKAGLVNWRLNWPSQHEAHTNSMANILRVHLRMHNNPPPTIERLDPATQRLMRRAVNYGPYGGEGDVPLPRSRRN